MIMDDTSKWRVSSESHSIASQSQCRRRVELRSVENDDTYSGQQSIVGSVIGWQVSCHVMLGLWHGVMKHFAGPQWP